jgi:hypothetical protein
LSVVANVLIVISARTIRSVSNALQDFKTICDICVHLRLPFYLRPSAARGHI